jgi:hypothetical protein
MGKNLSDDGLAALLKPTEGESEVESPSLEIVQDESTAEIPDRGEDTSGLRSMVVGRADSFVNTILSLVAEDRFDTAVQELRYYQELKGQLYIFINRTERYFDHCEELIRAIETKKGFPNFGNLAMSKQEEIHEMVRSHFDDLRGSLKQIQKVEKDIHIDDVRSTVWVIKALVISVGVIVALALSMQVARSLGFPLKVLRDDITSSMADGLEKALDSLGL